MCVMFDVQCVVVLYEKNAPRYYIVQYSRELCHYHDPYHDLNHDLNHDGTHTAHCGGKLVVGEVGEVGKGWKEVPVYPRIVGEYPIKPPI